MILANLDYETALARQRSIHIELPKRVRSMLAHISTLMAALANDDERLWTIEPVDHARLVGDALPNVELVSGEPAGDVRLAWGDMSAGQFNDRRFDFELGTMLGSNHQHTRLLSSVAELVAHIDCALTEDQPWVVKAPLSASGRFRLRRHGQLDDASRARATRLFAQFGQLLFEPWVQRIGDFGCVGMVSDQGVQLRPPHVLLVDRAGVFRGIALTHVAANIASKLTATAHRVGTEIRGRGYRGPFGVDSYQFRSSTGDDELRTFCELNARYSFGHIAWALAERIGEPIGLHLGRGNAPQHGHLLLAPAADDPTCAWWEPLTAAP